MAEKIVFDASEFPVVRITMPAAISDEEWMAGLHTISSFLDRKQPFGFVTLSGGAPSAPQRKAISELLTREEAAFRRYLKGWALVAPSAVLRGAITAIVWLKPPPFPQKPFATEAQAVAWLREALSG